MIRIPSKHTTAADSWTIGPWRDCRVPELALNFQDRGAAARWLLGLGSDDLRRVARRYGQGLALHRLGDPEIADWLAGLILAGSLRVCRTGRGGAEEARPAVTERGFEAEDKVLRRLRVTRDDFTFEGLRLRLVRADEWHPLFWNHPGRYQIVPHTEAARLLAKLADWPVIGRDERTAVREAIALIPETRGRAPASGLLLLRTIPGAVTSERSASGPAFTPSQLARQQRPPEPPPDIHWIEIELLDDQDQPVPNEPYRIELPDHSVRTGQLDADGRAYIGDIPVPGQCQISFPEIDQREWWAI